MDIFLDNQGRANNAIDQFQNAEEIKERLKGLRERKKKYESYQKKLEETGKSEISTTDPDARLMSNNNNNVDVS